jgi:GGDEF domain-containing protein
MMTDTLADVLSVMLRDHCRIEDGLEHLDRWLAARRPARAIEVAILDLDGSATVRARGLGAKRHVVAQVQREVRDCVPKGMPVIDSGTRDEMMIVAPDDARRGLRDVCEAIRLRIRNTEFSLPGTPETAQLTVSIGVTSVSEARSAEQLLNLGRQALAQAKARRDCVVEASADPGIPVEVHVPEILAADLARNGADLVDAVNRGIRTLQEKHEPMWYWVAEQGGAVTGIVPRLGYTVEDTLIGTAALTYFELLISQISVEAAAQAAEASGARLVLRIQPHPSEALAAEYLPGEWVVATPSADGSGPVAGSIFQRIENARRAQWPTHAATVHLATATMDTLRRISERRGRSVEELLAEALLLETDRTLITYSGVLAEGRPAVMSAR